MHLVNNTLVFLFLVCVSFNTNAQIRIEGFVKDSSDMPLPFVTVTASTTQSVKVVSYNFSDAKGYFSLTIPDSIEVCFLSASLLGYRKETKEIAVKKGQLSYQINFQLSSEAINMQSLTVKAQRPPVVVTRDTLTFNLKSFIDSTENTVEDVLKKLPGMQVKSDGTLTYNGRAIERILIEGDDLFNRDYKIPSQNLSSNLLENVQVIDRYNSNGLLKDIENTERLVINLNIKKDRKSRLFGNLTAGGGFENKHDAAYNLISFSKKIKIFNLGGTNNVGKELGSMTGGNSDRFFNQNQNADYYDPEVRAVTNIKTPSLSELPISTERFNRNMVFMNTFNFIAKPIEKWQIKGNFIIAKDRLLQDKTNRTDYLIGNQSFAVADTLRLMSNPLFYKAYIETEYPLSKKSNLELSSEFRQKTIGIDGFSIINTNSFSHKLNDESTYWKNLLHFTQKLTDSLAFVFHLTYSNDVHPQQFIVQPAFNYRTLFNVDSSYLNLLQQSSSVQTNYLGFEAQILGTWKSSNKINFKIGGSKKQDILNSDIGDIQDRNTLLSFKNNINYIENDVYAYSTYNKVVGDFTLNGRLDMHYLNAAYANALDASKSFNKNWLYPIFRLKATWEVDYKNKLSISFNRNTRFNEVDNLYDGYIFQNYRNIERNIISSNPIVTNSGQFAFVHNNSFRNIMGFLNVTYFQSENDWNNRYNFSQFYNLTDRIVLPARNKNLISMGEISKLFPRANLSFKFNTSHNLSFFYNSVGTDDFSNGTNLSSQYGLSIVSTFDGLFNFSLGNSWTNNVVKFKVKIQDYAQSSNSIEGFLSLNFKTSAKTNILIKNELYQFRSDFSQSPYHIFTDFLIKHKVKDQKLNVILEVKNILNVQNFIFTSVSPNQSVVNASQLLSRFGTLKIEWRF
jgi:CarboxypepD_reg-like domain